MLGKAYIQTRQPDRARADVRPHVRRARRTRRRRISLAAQMMIRLEFDAPAEAELKRAIEKDPKLPQAHALLGQIALFRGRLDEAVALTEREIALNPANAHGVLPARRRAACARASGTRRIAALQKSIWLNPFYSAPYILLGKAYMQKGQPATAEGHAAPRHRVRPQQPVGALPARPAAAAASDRADEAKREFEIAERLQGQAGR